MPLTTGQVTIAVCDACGTRKYAEAPKQVSGVTGHAMLVDNAGETNVDYYSCRSDAGHVGKAVRSALDKNAGAAHA